MKFITISIQDSLHFKFKNRCKYHDFTNNQVLTKLITNFVDGKYDADLGIQKEQV